MSKKKKKKAEEWYLLQDWHIDTSFGQQEDEHKDEYSKGCQEEI